MRKTARTRKEVRARRLGQFYDAGFPPGSGGRVHPDADGSADRRFYRATRLKIAYAAAAIAAAHGSVMIHERTIPIITFGFALPVVRPMPKSEPTATCVVETGSRRRSPE